MMITTGGIIIQIPAGDISIYGRNTSGVKLINIDDDVRVAKIAKVREKLSDGTQEFENVDEALDKVVDEPSENDLSDFDDKDLEDFDESEDTTDNE